MKNRIHKSLACLLTLCMLVMLFPVTALAAFSDVQGHWAQSAIENWSDLGIIKGYDGAFRPNDPITRGEMAVVIDRVMKYQTVSINTFTDLGQAFYTDAILKANAAGVIKGYGTLVRPTDYITREEAAVLLGRALGLSVNSTDTAAFSDSSNISTWAVGYVNAMWKAGYVHGTNGKFNPKLPITRAEVVAMLNNSVKAQYNVAKEYTGVVYGTVIVNTPGAVLKDMTINGDLIISEGVGSGDVTLINVVVTGNTIVRGGGANSIHIEGNSQLPNIIIEKADDGSIRIVTSDGAIVSSVVIYTCEGDVILTGSFGNVTIAAGISVKLVDAHIATVEIAGEDSALDINNNSTVGTLTINGEINVNNAGSINTAVVNANDVIIIGNVPVAVSVANTVTIGPTDGNGNALGGGSSTIGGWLPSTVLVSAITVTGDAVVGATLTAAPTPDEATGTYQWKSSDTANGTYANITDATSSTYVIGEAYLGDFIKVTFTATGSYSGTQTSAATVAVTDTDAYDAIVVEVGALDETDYTAVSWGLYGTAIDLTDLTLTSADGQAALDAEVIAIQAALDLLAAPIIDVTSGFFSTSEGNNTVTITLTDGTFKTGTIAATDFTFTGSDAGALAAIGATFTRTSETVVTITNLTGLSTYGPLDKVTVLAATQATQASSVVAVASAAPVIDTVSVISGGDVNPTITVTGTNFKSNISTRGDDLYLSWGTFTGLTFVSVTYESATEITVAFTGTAVAGYGNTVTIQAKPSAFNPAGTSVSNILTVRVTAAVPTAKVSDLAFTDTDTRTGEMGGTLSWTAPADITNVTYYKVYASADRTTKGAWLGTSPVESVNELQISVNTTYAPYIIVVTVNAGGEAIAANYASIAVTDVVPVALITSATYNVSTGELVLTGVNFNTGAAIDVTKLTIVSAGI